MEYDGMHFVDAVETLAESVGLTVPFENNQGQVNRDRHKPLYTLMTDCESLFVSKLKEQKTAIDYLKQRGLSGEIAKNFAIGYAPEGWDVLSKAFPGKEAQLLETGMLTRNDKGRVYDRFRDRIMFPIRDRRGRVVAFGGRVLNDGEPKYLNSPETVLFHKGAELYGLFEGRKHIQDAGRALVVEGYMDVVALAQHGIKYAVATLGTATNEQHCETLFRVIPEIVFCFDGDRAGQDAAWRALQATLPCLRDGRDAHFLFLPQGQDPDSLITEQGKSAFDNQLKKSITIVDFLFEHLSDGADLEQIGARARLVEQATPLLQKIPLGVYKKLAEQKLESLIGMSLQNIPARQKNKSEAQAHQTKRFESTTRHVPQRTQIRSLTTMRRAVLLVLSFPEVTQSLEADKYDFDPELPGARLLLKLIALADKNPTISSGAMIEHFRGEPEWDVIDKLSTTPYFPDGREIDLDNATLEFSDCIDGLNKQSKPREANKVPDSARTGLLGIRKRSDD